jgi:ATP-binding cassette subfamily B protein
MKELMHLLPYFKKYKGLLLIGIACIAFQNIMGIYVPVIVRDAIDAIKAALEGSSVTTLQRSILIAIAIIVGLSILKGVGMYYMRQTIIVMSRHIEFDQRNSMYLHYQNLPTTFFKKHATGDLMARINEDVSRVRMFTGPAILYAFNLVMLTVMVIAMMFYENAELAALTLIPLPFMSYAVYYVNNLINKKSEDVQEQLSVLTSTSQEVFSGIRVIKSYVQENASSLLFETQANEYKKRSLNLAFIESVYFPLLGFLIGLSSIIIIYFGGKLISVHQVTPGNIAEFILYLNMLVWPVTSLGWVASTYQRAVVSQRRINEFMLEPVLNEAACIDKVLKGNIALTNCSLTYENTGIQALKAISIGFKEGEKIAIIGKTGSGKSTVAQLLLKAILVDEGKIEMEGTSINQIAAATIRNYTAIVPQDLFLFSDTVSNNIALGLNEVSTEQIVHYAKMAGIHDEIMQLPQQYETLIGERGVLLSGGQKQRLCIARALIKQPTVLVFDDCLSAVDTQTEQFILQNLQSELIGKTVINITHRVVHLLHFDQIIVLEQGQVIESGTPKELLQKDSYFASIYKEQMRMEPNS